MSNNADNEEDRVNYRAKFKDLMELAITKDPENGILLQSRCYFTEQGESDAAIDYYKAINFRPDYVDAYLNLVSVILDGEQAVVDEMNSLGTSKRIILDMMN